MKKVLIISAILLTFFAVVAGWMIYQNIDQLEDLKLSQILDTSLIATMVFGLFIGGITWSARLMILGFVSPFVSWIVAENVYTLIRPWWGSMEPSTPFILLFIVTIWFGVPAIIWYLAEWLKGLWSKPAAGDRSTN